MRVVMDDPNGRSSTYGNNVYWRFDNKDCPQFDKYGRAACMSLFKQYSTDPVTVEVQTDGETNFIMHYGSGYDQW